MVERDRLAETLQLLMGVDQSDTDAMRLALRHEGTTLHMLGTKPPGEILSGTIESLPSLAKELGKAAPQVHIEDHGLMVRTQASALLKTLFTHLLRDPVDHAHSRHADLADFARWACTEGGLIGRKAFRDRLT
ncbi:MAG: hypothetical protein HY855_23170 [Burkholderiales bacterium]|nr:hypothetical protein [Burkholderiales bacterium]